MTLKEFAGGVGSQPPPTVARQETAASRSGGILQLREPQTVEEMMARYAASRKRVWDPPVVKEDPEWKRVRPELRALELSLREDVEEGGPRSRDVDPDTMAEIRRMYVAGRAVRWICIKMGVHPSVVARATKGLGDERLPTPARMYRRRLDHEDAYQRAMAGEPSASIAQTYGVDPSTVRCLVRRLREERGGVPVKPKVWRFDRAAALRLYHAGQSFNAIAALYGIDRKHIAQGVRAYEAEMKETTA